MRKFWLWYDEIAETQPGLRFLVFMAIAVVCWVIVPFIVSVFYGSDAMVYGQMMGAFCMIIIALIRHISTRNK